MVLQGIFRRNATFVVVRHLRLTGKTVLKVGTEVPSDEYPLKQYHLRSLFLRRLIGIQGSPWADSMLAGHNPTSVMKEEDFTVDEVKEEPEEEVVVPEPEVKKAKAKETITKKAKQKKETKVKKQPWDL